MSRHHRHPPTGVKGGLNEENDETETETETEGEDGQ